METWRVQSQNCESCNLERKHFLSLSPEPTRTCTSPDCLFFWKGQIRFEGKTSAGDSAISPSLVKWLVLTTKFFFRQNRYIHELLNLHYSCAGAGKKAMSYLHMIHMLEIRSPLIHQRDSDSISCHPRGQVWQSTLHPTRYRLLKIWRPFTPRRDSLKRESAGTMCANALRMSLAHQLNILREHLGEWIWWESELHTKDTRRLA